MATVQTVTWKPMVRECLHNYPDERYYIAMIYKGKIERRVNDNIKLVRQSAWDDAVAAANKLNEQEQI